MPGIYRTRSTQTTTGGSASHHQSWSMRPLLVPSEVVRMVSSCMHDDTGACCCYILGATGSDARKKTAWGLDMRFKSCLVSSGLVTSCPVGVIASHQLKSLVLSGHVLSRLVSSSLVRSRRVVSRLVMSGRGNREPPKVLSCHVKSGPVPSSPVPSSPDYFTANRPATPPFSTRIEPNPMNLPASSMCARTTSSVNRWSKHMISTVANHS